MKNNIPRNIVRSVMGLGVLLCGYLAACKKDAPAPCPCSDPTNPAWENYDSCLTKQPLTADFHIYSQGFDTELLVFNRVGGYTRFEAEEENAQYEWVLGNETITTRSFVRHFNQVPPHSFIDVHLKVTKTPDTVCYPNDSGEANKTFTVMKWKNRCDANILGTYKVEFTNKRGLDIASDSSIVFIETYVKPNAFECSGVRLVEVINGDSVTIWDDSDDWETGSRPDVSVSDLCFVFEYPTSFVVLAWPSQRIEGNIEFYGDRYVTFKGRKI